MDNLLLHKIETIAGHLNQSLSSIELSNGWQEDTRIKWLKFFENLMANIKNKDTIPERSIASGMDFDGICNGELFEQGAVISNMLRKQSNLGGKNA